MDMIDGGGATAQTAFRRAESGSGEEGRRGERGGERERESGGTGGARPLLLLLRHRPPPSRRLRRRTAEQTGQGAREREPKSTSHLCFALPEERGEELN